jgi:uroporphyrinogen-III synthase
LQNFNQKDGALIYISGETVSVDLDQQLLKEGYNIKRVINYRTIHNQNFDDEFVNQLKLKMPDMVYVYSQNSALSLLNFIKMHQSESLWMNTNLMCIGEKTSSILNEIKWKKIFLFNPGEEEFLLYKI